MKSSRALWGVHPMFEIRIPRAEARKKSEIRIPKNKRDQFDLFSEFVTEPEDESAAI